LLRVAVEQVAVKKHQKAAKSDEKVWKVGDCFHGKN